MQDVNTVKPLFTISEEGKLRFFALIIFEFSFLDDIIIQTSQDTDNRSNKGQ